MDMITVERQLEIATARFAHHVLNSPDSPLKDPLITAIGHNKKLYTHTSVIYNLAAIATEYKIKDNESLEPLRRPPWYRHNGIINIRELGQAKNHCDAQSVRASFEKQIKQDSNKNAKLIFTDGSVNEDGRSGSGIYIMEANKEATYIRVRISDNSSSTQAELIAIRKALSWAVDNKIPEQEIIIYTDSQTSLRNIQNYKPWSNIRITQDIQDLIELLHGIGKTVTLNWIPSHIGIPGNEIADSIAKEACHADSIDVRIDRTKKQIMTHIKNKAFMFYSVQCIIHANKENIIEKIIDKDPNRIIHRLWHENIVSQSKPPETEFQNIRETIAISRMRMGNVYNPYESKQICNRCQISTFSWPHYLAECPATRKQRYNLNILSNLETNNLDELASNIIINDAKVKYTNIKKLLREVPLEHGFRNVTHQPVTRTIEDVIS